MSVVPDVDAALDLDEHREALLETLRSYGRVAVAYSGGVDSVVVAKAAQVALGDAAIAVTAVSQSLAGGELEEARTLAREIGIRHRVIHTQEFDDPNYLRNNPDRCYFCKSELYGRLARMMDELEIDAVVSGINADDSGDYRPGLKAAEERGVRHPLQECGIGKAGVRELARHWGLSVWDKPATPCLSSRIAYGEPVTPERVQMVDKAEKWLRAQGLRLLRVRYHKNDMARVEVPLDELPKLAAEPVRSELVRVFREAGFKYVALDLEGFRSGSLNAMIASEQLKLITKS